MKYAIAAFAAAAIGIGAAYAADSPSSSGSSSSSSSTAVKMSQSECTSLWQKANGSTAGLTEAQAKPYISDFKAANPDGDATIDQSEFLAACNKGLVQNSASTGASSGTSGSSSGSSEHPPAKAMDKAVPDMKSPSSK